MASQDLCSGFRLSPQQRLRWLVDLPAPGMELDIKGNLDPQRLKRTLESLTALHEPLRMQLRPLPGLKAPLQIISDSGAVHFEGNDNPTEGEPAGMTARLVTLADDHHRLHLRLPPLSADRGTLSRLARALAAYPEEGQDADEMTYTRYATWLYQLQTDEDAEEGRQYWAQRCAPDWQPGDLVYQQTTGTAPAIAVTTLPAGPALDNALDTFCRAHGYSPSEFFITAWAVLLQRLSTGLNNKTTVPLGWVHDCREDYEELASCWGLFSKALPLPWAQSLDGHFSDALAQMRQCQEEASEWQEYYAIENEPQAAHIRFGFEWGGRLSAYTGAAASWSVEITAVQAQTQWFELLIVPEQDAAGHYRLHLHHDTGSYSAQTAVVLLEQYRSLLLDALENPSRSLQSLSLHSPSFDRTLKALEAPQSVPEITGEDLLSSLFSRRAGEFHDHIALCDSDPTGAVRRLNYRDLEARSNRLAHHLRSQGIGPESRVALYIERSADLVLAMLAVLKSGGAFLPLETQQPAARTLAILEAANPDLIVSTEKQQAPCLPGVTHLAVDAVSLESCPATPPEVAIHPDNAAYLLFTSGSTGTPKGVVVAHRQLHNYVTSILSRVALKLGDKSALVTSLAADLSYTLLFSGLLSGGELHIIDRNTTMDPQAWATYQSRHAIDNLKLVPSLLEAWLSHSDPAAVLPKKQLILGGEACRPALLKKIHACAPALQVYNHYGPTETTIGVLMHKANTPPTDRPLPLSDRLDHTRVYILDNGLNPVAPGQQGELYIAGPNLARGYLCARQTAERFIPNPFSCAGERLYRTGDLARYRPDGAIDLLGRADRQVKMRGFRIELDEIETLLESLTAVRQAAVVCVPREHGDLQMFAFVSLKPDQQGSIAQLQGQLQDRLPDYMLPTLRLVDTLPLMENGKLDRQALCEQARKMLNHVGTTLPRTPFEEWLADLWADALGLEKIGVDDDFFALGGHSLAAVKLASRLQKALSTPVKINAIFSAPTVAQFAELVKRDLKLSPLVDLSASSDTSKSLLFCFHPSTGHLLDYRPLIGPLAQWQLWGLQAGYLASPPSRETSIDSLAAGYVTHLRRQQPQGPYYLLGWSLGGLVAITAAAQLEDAGEEVAFLGVVDSQLATDETAQSIEELLQSATEELDSASQARLHNLTPREREELIARLNAVDQGERPFALSRWAQQQGLQLKNDSWQHLEARLHRYAHTQQLIGSFNPPRLRCVVTVWWAQDTLDTGDAAPVDWHQLTGSPVTVNIIEGNHMNILKQPGWQQQLRDSLSHAKQAFPRQRRWGRQPETAETIDEIV